MRRQVAPDASGNSMASYSSTVGFIFIFNLIVGTGALTLPAVFVKAGWCLSLIVISILALVSYMTVTFVIESMACSNAIQIWQNLQLLRRHRNSVDLDTQHYNQHTDDSHNDVHSEELETMPLNIENEEFQYYQLTYKFELAEMAALFFSEIGRTLFYLCFIIYLYGDLSIYSAAIARTLRDVICDHGDNTISNNRSDVMIFGSEDFKLSANRTCWEEHVISRLSMYRIILVFFTLIVGPIVSLSIQKTKYLQIFTAVLRWLAFTFMICITTKMLITSGPKGHPVAVNVYGSPSLFGACVYSFMCHHSLPSLLAPLRNKEKVIQILWFDYILICAFYIVLAMTGIFAFEHVDELYTLNFLPYNVEYEDFLTGLLIVINYFLSLFPVFALSTSYPVIAITLKNNLKILFLDMTQYDSYHIITRSIFPLLAIIPPFCVTYFTESLSTLVAFTGTYAGAGIQYIIPVCLVYFSRSTCSELLGCGIVNQYQSPFKSKIWLGLVILWSIICVSLVTINLLG